MIEQPVGQSLVMKFGGTSVGTPTAMAGAVSIVKTARASWPRLVVVTSALSGVTNLLLDTATASTSGDTTAPLRAAQEIKNRHVVIIHELITDIARRAQVQQEIDHLINEFINLCQAVSVLGEATPRALDAISAIGERMAVRVLAAAIESSAVPAQWIESTKLVMTDRQFQSAHPDMHKTRQQVHDILEPVLAQGRVAVVTGFIGATPDGITTTLGRGGSDFSAALLGAALPAREVWIWTDVDGVMTTDPRVVPTARTIPTLSYKEVAELAYFGAKVLHPKTIRPVIDAGVGLRVCNTFHPENPGTWLVSESQAEASGAVKAVTAIRGLQLITVEGRGMLGVPGVAARTFGSVAATGTSVPLITQASSEQSICFAVPKESTQQVLENLQAEFAVEINRQDIDRIWATGEVVIVTVVGAGMRNTPGVSGKVFSALGEQSVNVIAIAQGSSEVSISLIVSAEEMSTAVQALHNLIQVP